MTIAIKTENLSHQNGTNYLLRNINWEVKSGEHWMVFGMNGCGKTTLLSIIAGFKSYTEGKLQVLGEEYCNDNILSLRSRIGFVSSSFFDKMYTKEQALHIVLAGKYGKLGLEDDFSNQDIIRAKQLLAEFNLEKKINAQFCTMSKGERQNVLIARALFAKPEILLLDEPGAGLDILAREHLYKTIEILAEKTAMTLIYVTHYMDEILPCFDHTLMLKTGSVFACGKSDELFQKEVIEKLLDHPLKHLEAYKQGYTLEMDVTSNIERWL